MNLKYCKTCVYFKIHRKISSDGFSGIPSNYRCLKHSNAMLYKYGYCTDHKIEFKRLVHETLVQTE